MKKGRKEKTIIILLTTNALFVIIILILLTTMVRNDQERSSELSRDLGVANQSQTSNNEYENSFKNDTEHIYSNVTQDLNKIRKTATDLSTKSQKETEDFCFSLDNVQHKDYCFRIAAVNTMNDSFCNSIMSQATKDFCYMNFAVNDFSVCEKIENEKLRKACEDLKITSNNE